MFDEERKARIRANGENTELAAAARNFTLASVIPKYSYNFSWLGRPIFQYPQDIVAVQEIIWSVKPDLIIETGIAHGGSLIFSASMLELNAACGGPKDAEVLGVDIDIRAHNREAIIAHPMSKRISMIEGSSVAPEIVERARAKAAGKKSILVCLDSNHSHSHVLAELNSYAPMATIGSYCIVFDTAIEEMSQEMLGDRPWAPGNSPKSAVREFLKTHEEFEIDKQIDSQILVSMAADGYLKRIA